MVRVLVVDDHEMFSEALALLLEQQPEMRLIGSARDADAALELCRDEQPEVVLMDLDLPKVDGVEATRRIRERYPETRVVVVTAAQDPAVVATAITAGACGYVPKTKAADELLDVVRRAAAGEFVMPEADLAAVLEELQASRARWGAEPTLTRLTRRETEILEGLAIGESPSEVAASLGISALTVKTHVKRILAKLGVHSKIEAVTLAWRHGLSQTQRSTRGPTE